MDFKNKKLLLIDDRRDYIGIWGGIRWKFLRQRDVAFTIARNYEKGIEALQSQKWDAVWLDHDIASYCEERQREVTGYDIVCWLEANPEHCPEKVFVITSNTPGGNRMVKVLMKMKVFEGWVQ